MSAVPAGATTLGHEGIEQEQCECGREKQLKGWRRSKKIALINSINPDWKDLNE
jgi:putative endonuclease